MSTFVYQTCCECGNCVRICPRRAVTLERDGYGNCRAVIDETLCVECGLCTKTCPMGHPAPSVLPEEVYAAVSAAPEAGNSTSGGMFFELARSVLADGGVVAGAAYGEGWNIYHVLIQDPESLEKLQGSKYAKSDVTKAAPQIKDALLSGRTVLFCGTPCQVAALKLDIREPELQQRLFTVDLICHGTPPIRLFQDYIAHLEAKHRGKMASFCFRDKTYGNKLVGSYSVSKGGRTRKFPLYAAESAYYHLFLEGLTYTQCCYACPYAKGERCSDITIGDFWGWREEIPAFAASNGLPADASVSAVMLNSKRGAVLFQRIRPRIFSDAVPYEKIQKHNGQLCAPVRIGAAQQERIMESYCSDGYPGLVRIHRQMTDLRRYSVRIAGLLPSGLKESIKKFQRKRTNP